MSSRPIFNINGEIGIDRGSKNSMSLLKLNNKALSNDKRPSSKFDSIDKHPNIKGLRPARNDSESSIVITNCSTRKKSYFNFDPFNVRTYNSKIVSK